MTARSNALDILIEDLALQVLSARAASGQAGSLCQLLDTVRTAMPRSRAKDRLLYQRILTRAAGKAGEKRQEMDSLVSTLEWDLRLYLSERDGQGKPRPTGRGASSARQGRSR